ncbi:sensor histidine kinase [Paenibacillus sp. CF384]|uniref:cache domain-containing sensor histidine kinase n=1 Tax=Paenibacillus sp. CF384 TaxID=1884382 RepID=UPI0008950871|nr:sensor histidine kinase [Paenibacillus sp. CF384]SDW05674.1 HAMP domain-containing protein [Paenibacillus sp. CF384]
MAIYNRNKRVSLANQLVLSFLVIFLIIFSLSSLFAYLRILAILKNNAKETTLRQFKQYDYNLTSFASEVDQLSRMLVLDSELYDLINYKSKSELDRALQVGLAFRNFTQNLTDYKYIKEISFFGDDGFAIRTTAQSNEILVDPKDKVNEFYRSQIYEQAVSGAQKLVWLGGFTDKNFEITEGLTATPEAAKPVAYISAARSFFSNNEAGTLVINLDMKYFTDIYNHANDISSNELYLVDDRGRIVSNSNEASIGESGMAPLQTNASAASGNKFSSEERSGKQIMSYRIDSLGWELVNEIPVSVFTSDALTLRTIVLTMFVFSLASAAVISRFWILKVTKPLNSLTNVVRKMGQGNLGLTLDVEMRNELGILITQFNKMSKNIFDLMEQKETIQEEKRMIEIGALQSQINPHFFYNSLNTIKWMAIMAKADNIVESITTLGDYLQPMFSKGMYCTIQEEIDYIENYTKIMNYRMAGGIKVEHHVPVEIRECQILRFLLQPLVENAITHGLKNRSGGIIEITAEERGSEIVWSIRDNGEGMTEARLQEVRRSLVNWDGEDRNEQKGIGLYNTNRRLQLHFGDHYRIHIESRPHEGTELKFAIPKVQKP